MIENADQVLKHPDPTKRTRDFLRQRSEAYLNLKSYSLAISDYKKILQSWPDDRRVRECLVAAYELSGNKAAAS